MHGSIELPTQLANDAFLSPNAEQDFAAATTRSIHPSFPVDRHIRPPTGYIMAMIRDESGAETFRLFREKTETE
jgi:hypothetical protein